MQTVFRRSDTSRHRLWAITSYFNPSGSSHRLTNFRAFRSALHVPLLAVEFAPGAAFELRQHDADVIVRTQRGSILWQKERLLNVAISALPDACEYVAWLDADVLFGTQSWPKRAERALGSYPLIQLFEAVQDVDALGRPVGEEALSTALLITRGGDPLPGLRDPSHRSGSVTANGLAWAARRDLLESTGFYDACVLGSGDRAMLSAAIGQWNAAADALLMSEAHRVHFEQWAVQWHSLIRGRLGVIPGKLWHLAHGTAHGRGIGTRYRAFARHGFDPLSDVAVSEEGPWKWCSDKHDMHATVLRYFADRRD